MDNIVFANASCGVGDGQGGYVIVKLDEPWHADDPVVRRNPTLFDATPSAVRRSVAVQETTDRPLVESRARR